MAVKLLSIIRDNHPRDFKPTDNVLLDEILYLGLCDHCQRFCLDPFYEIVNGDKQKFDLLFTLWQWTNKVNPPC